MKCPKQAVPVQRPSTSAAISNQKGVKPSTTAFEEILRGTSGASGLEVTLKF
ncbi:hypothetical protein BJP36_37535 [Moorena producens JHB]|uniref:Uncharacterized protein n=1 Tax=Moorena producens (strain JHB) TaxID=1454205 RepID=A0A9Q9UWE1_MOOP1|nr:hypothetical protein [Moorena producens]WAN69801.1 hypothetical protein BJP36_37535 [Moorena producens JHB]